MLTIKESTPSHTGIEAGKTWRQICDEQRGGPMFREEDLERGFYHGGIWISSAALIAEASLASLDTSHQPTLRAIGETAVLHDAQLSLTDLQAS